MFKLMAETASGRVELLNDDLRELAAKHLAEIAADAANSASRDETTSIGKKRGRPIGSKNAASSPGPDDNGVDLAALAAGQP